MMKCIIDREENFPMYQFTFQCQDDFPVEINRECKVNNYWFIIQYFYQKFQLNINI